jgi:hypothetical protein
VSILVELVDLLMGILPGDAETLSQLRYRGVVQLVFFEKSMSLFSRGNTFLRHRLHLLHELSVTHVFRICVTYVFRFF